MPEHHADFAAAFAPGLLDPDQPTPDFVTGHSGKAANLRFNVYRNNVTASLLAAVGEIFPLTRRALGEDAFRAAALTFVRDHPPTSKLVFEFGHGFDRHLADRGFAAGDRGWIADVALLERIWLDAYHAADEDPLAPAALGAIPPEKLGAAVFRTHPAARLVACRTAVVSLMAALKSGDDTDAALGKARERPAETALVTRPALAVDVRALDDAAVAFFAALVAGKPLGEAAGEASIHEGFDLAAALGAVLETGAFASVDVEESS